LQLGSNQSNPDIFVSYSSEDRSIVLPVVDSLCARGIRIWIDRYQIPGGAEYTQEIPHAIGQVKGVLLFASPHAFTSRNVRRELDIAWKKGKRVIPVFLTLIDVPESFEWYLESVQHIPLHDAPPEQWPDLISEPLTKWGIHISQPAEQASSIQELQANVRLEPKTVSEPMAVGPLIPYLIDRIQQERELRQALTRHSQRTVRRPLIIVAHGLLEQAMYEYVQRIERDSLPKALKHVGYSDHIKWINLPWTPEDWQTHPDRTIKRLQEDTEAALELRPNSWTEGLIETITNFRSVVVLCYRVTSQGWNETHLATLKAYVQTWGCLPELTPGYPLIVFFTFQQQASPPHLLDRLNRWRRQPPSLYSQLCTLAELDGADMGVAVLPELGNVVFSDIEYWILNDVRPPDPVRMIHMVREVLNDPELIAGRGVPMRRLIDRLYVLVENTAQEQMTP
jgi:hypothetical protein